MQYSLCRAVMSAFASPVFHDCIRACLLALLFVIVPSVLGSTAQALFRAFLVLLGSRDAHGSCGPSKGSPLAQGGPFASLGRRICRNVTNV
jgi:hypothetical protein